MLRNYLHRLLVHLYTISVSCSLELVPLVLVLPNSLCPFSPCSVWVKRRPRIESMFVFSNLSVHYGVNCLFQTVDSKGLITADRKGLQAHKTCLFSMQVLYDHLLNNVNRFRPYRLHWTSFDKLDRHHPVCQTHRFARFKHYPSRLLYYHSSVREVNHWIERIHGRSREAHGGNEQATHYISPL